MLIFFCFCQDRDNVVDPLTDDLWKFCFQHNVSLETINFILNQLEHGAEDNQYVNDEVKYFCYKLF